MHEHRLYHGGKGNHRNLEHPMGVRMTISGRSGSDARPYQEKAVKQALQQMSE
jgi:predicted RNA binding protein YcfA (HicA-like mRNA interferase family)